MFGSKKSTQLDTQTSLPADVASQTSGRSSGLVITTLVDKAQRLQQPAVARYVANIRRRHPDESPEQIIRRLERHYLTTVTASGGAVGAAAAVPGVGTVTALGAMSAETVFFIEASALLALAIADVHGIAPTQHDRRRALVLAVALGDEGVGIIGKTLGKSNKNAIAQLGVPGIPGANLATINKALTNRFVKKFTIGKAPVMFGKVLPGGIGAVIGGVGNRALGTAVIRNARNAFGQPPRRWLTVIDGAVDGTVIAPIEGVN
ncbi:hypothetical protein [Gordonia liuliyuniae]|uniref:EcsC protein family protein n=1 Tax=Gordonia liuliyuniae TaxID=2911517 RepID=A0ABS9IXE7_9ACTN|nr:hypothetical protein [Gordonia liuliyuniae]MCF8590243.1 hypothetical protein [Gordonia liuliyuniae]